MSVGGSSTRSTSRQMSNIVYRYGDGVRRVMNRPAAETVQKVDPTDAQVRQFLGVDVDAQFTNDLPALPLPAAGDPYGDCGDEQPLLFCSRCGGPYYVSRRCRRAMCSACWRSWVKDRTVGSSSEGGAVGIASKIEGRKRYINAKHRAMHGGDEYGTLRHHVAVSPPPEFAMRRDDVLDAGFQIVKQLCQDLGADEGAIVYHPYRIKEEYRGEVLGHDSGDGDLQWRHVIAMIEVIGFEPVRDEFLTFAPHFHCFLLSDYFHGDTKGLEERSGWIVERIEGDNEASIRTLPNLVSAVGYSLSHVGLTNSERGLDAAYRYFGEVANFQPTDGVRADCDRAFRAVAPEIVGQAFPELQCDQDGHGVENEGLTLPGGEWSSTPEDPIEGECRGVHESMRKAPQYYNDPEWIAGAPRWTDLYHSYREFRRIYDGTKPPPEVGLPPPLRD